MRRHSALSLAALPLALAGLTACGAEDEKKGFAVPDGVVKQYEVLNEEITEKGKTAESGEWTVNLITEAAEPWHEVHGGGHSAYRAPRDGETNHIEIIPVETATGRIVPDVPITLEVVGTDGKVVQKLDLTFYYSTFFHYANNFSVPAGEYTLRATLGAPTFPRHGAEDEAPALVEGTTVEFKGIALGAE